MDNTPTSIKQQHPSNTSPKHSVQTSTPVTSPTPNIHLKHPHVPFGEVGRIRTCAPRYPQRTPPPVSTRASPRCALLRPSTDPPGGRPEAVDLAQAAAARVCAVRRFLPRGPVRAPDVGRRATAHRPTRDFGRRRRAPRRLSQQLALCARVSRPLQALTGAVPRARDPASRSRAVIRFTQAIRPPRAIRLPRWTRCPPATRRSERRRA
jgi:hypothetical protein